MLVLVLSGCSNPSPMPGYSCSSTGVYYKLHRFGENNKKPHNGDYITCDLVYQTIDDSVFFSARRKIKITPSTYPGSVDECFSMIREGDSASFVLNADNFFNKTLQTSLPGFIPPKGYIKISIALRKIQSKDDFNREKKEFLSWIKDFGEYEQTVLKNYIEKEQISVNPSHSGIYKILINEGNEKNVHNRDTIEVQFEGRFLNGKIFDSTWKRQQAFEFVFGDEWQVVKGLEEAIATMHEGERSIFIMPSELAFGRQGSSTGIIPPFTSVIFEVELINIKP